MVENREHLQPLPFPGESDALFARRLSLLRLRDTPKARSLHALLRIWLRAKLQRNALPGYLPVGEIRDCQMLHNFHVYDVSKPNLLDTFASIWGTHAVIYSGKSQAANTLRAIHNEAYRDWVMATLFHVKSQGIPYLEEVAAQQMPQESATSLSRYRLLLPLSSDGQTVDRIMMSWAFVRPTLTSA